MVKCETYVDMATTSHCVAFFLCIGLVVHACCIWFTLRMTPRSLRWAAIWWFPVLVLHIGGILTHFFLFEELFGNLQYYSWYPDPQPGISFILSSMSAFFLLIVAMLAVQLHFFWPEEDFSDLFTSSEDSDDSDTPSKKRGKQKKKNKDDSSSSDEDYDPKRDAYGAATNQGQPQQQYGQPPSAHWQKAQQGAHEANIVNAMKQ